MPGGPLHPHSAYPATSGKVFPSFHIGNGNSRGEEGMGVMASVDGDATWELRFKMPEVLPSGTAKLQIHGLADATSGVAKINVQWKSFAIEEDTDGTALETAEGVGTITWSGGDADVYKELKVTLDADTIVAGETIVLHLIFETASWTLAQVLTCQAFIIWE